MPRNAAQFEAMADDQQDTFATFIMGAIVAASPGKHCFLNMVRLACDHRELAELEHLLTVKDDSVRGGLFASLVGSILERTAEQGVRRYLRKGARIP